MDARYGTIDERPPLMQRVVLTMENGAEFDGCRTLVSGGDDGKVVWAWMTADEHEPLAPECWTEGVCWDDSEQPRHWRYK